MTTTEQTFNAEINKAYKPLTKEVELDMLNKAKQGSTSARNAIINSQLRKLVEIARSYVVTNDRNDMSELIAVGIAGYQNKNGLTQAIEDFDTTQGNRFITFALRYIVNAIRDYSLDNRLVRIPRNKAKSRPNDPKLIAEHTFYAECRGMTLEEYIEHRKKFGEHISLRGKAEHQTPKSMDAPVRLTNGKRDSLNTFGDTLADDAVDMDIPIMMGELDLALSALSSDERGILREHFNDGMTLQEMGDERNVSRQAVSMRIEKIITKARNHYKAVKG